MSDSLRPHGLYSPWNSPGQNTGVGSLSLLQGIFPTQGSNPCLPHCRRILYQLSHKGRKIHGQRSLIGSHSLIGLHRTIEPYSPWGHKELDTTEQLHFTIGKVCISRPVMADFVTP